MGTAHAQTVRLEEAVQSTTAEISYRLEPEARIAIVSMQAGSYTMSNHLIGRMINDFVNIGRLTVLDRQELDRALAELDLQMEPVFDDTTARSIGRFMGAHSIIVGRFNPLVDFYYLHLRVLNVETGVVQASSIVNVQNDETVSFLLGPVGRTPTAQAQLLPSAFRLPAEAELLEPSRIRFWGLGASFSSSFAEMRDYASGPFGFTLHATLAPWNNVFFMIGCDFFWADHERGGEFSSTFSVYPFAHVAFGVMTFTDRFLPWGAYVGIGGGFMRTSFRFGDDTTESRTVPAMDFTVGFQAAVISLSYTLRTNFSTISDRFSLGVTLNLQPRGNR